jgi:hypothetical protein
VSFSVKISGLDEVLANKLVLVREQFGDFEAADRIDSHFERGHAKEAPLHIVSSIR